MGNNMKYYGGFLSGSDRYTAKKENFTAMKLWRRTLNLLQMPLGAKTHPVR